MKKYFIEEDGKKAGPYDVYDLKDIGIKATTPICTSDDAEWYNAEEFPELLHILEKNPVKKFDYDKDRVFGYRLAENGDRKAARIRSAIILLPLAVTVVMILNYLNINLKKVNIIFFIYFIVTLASFYSYTIYNILKKSSPHGGKNPSLKLISAIDGKFINEIAKKDFNRALNISLKYTFLPDFGDYTNPKKIQTFPERIARVYLVKNERRGNNPI